MPSTDPFRAGMMVAGYGSTSIASLLPTFDELEADFTDLFSLLLVILAFVGIKYSELGIRNYPLSIERVGMFLAYTPTIRKAFAKDEG